MPEHGLPEDPANALPEDHGVGNFDLNEVDDLANGLPEDHGVGNIDLNEAEDPTNGLAEDHEGGDESGEEQQAGADRQSYEVMVRVLQQTFDDARALVILTIVWKGARGFESQQEALY
ncbi:hypothetical protein R1sor_000262 [Riccia sorocarpa]|uniref:Uncharacterized protein n=1 Tax=Riccia sorocarpa TaxID=122646 RepID=A0ABD3GVU1_9MARC